MNRNDPPSILLVEDDPTTLAYLEALTAALPAQVETARGMAAALQRALRGHHDLWLVDANLPDGDGATLLARLRSEGLRTPALAHTATRDAAELDALHKAGFSQVLAKPVDAHAWKSAIAAALSLQTKAAPPVAPPTQAPGTSSPQTWDDEAASRALGGDPSHVATLRALFLAELPAQVAAIGEHGAQAMQAQLHRLRASCALVGAARLDAAVRALQSQPDSEQARAAFDSAAAAALAQPPASGG